MGGHGRANTYVPAAFDDPDGYRRLASHLEQLDREPNELWLLSADGEQPVVRACTHN